MTSDGERSHITVDGEEFAVHQPHDAPGTYHFTWLTGRNPGYGFSCRIHPSVQLTEEQLAEQISGFLTQVDPVSGCVE
ncbi:hypothetical protein [Streptomyces sp. NPDC047000]|uniref:hypothetical protein n=1 Tax=Streptomyces sp. NPDC047000 TaxID=3155474 RepID=UPI0033CE0612